MLLIRARQHESLKKIEVRGFEKKEVKYLNINILKGNIWNFVRKYIL
jgi:hypothetical protein